MFVDRPSLSLKGGLASGVPGEIAGYWLASQKYGNLPWKKLIEPIIDLCEKGVKVSKTLSNALKQYEKTIEKDEGLAQIFINSNTGKIYKENETIRYLKLANTLKIISENGSKAFYDGQLSSIIVNENNLNDGIMSLDDLKSYRPIEREPIKIKLNSNYTIYTMPPPSSGVLVTFILGLMQSSTSIFFLKCF
jgi:gamma-glutamyltranspeptidase / glutathione hydrolase / leukotriene-C4 hydrolase